MKTQILLHTNLWAPSHRGDEDDPFAEAGFEPTTFRV